MLHEYEVPPEAVSVVLAPAQTETVAGEMEAVGKGLTDTKREAVAEQEPPSVTVTKYVVAEVGETVMVAVVSFVLQE